MSEGYQSCFCPILRVVMKTIPFAIPTKRERSDADLFLVSISLHPTEIVMLLDGLLYELKCHHDPLRKKRAFRSNEEAQSAFNLFEKLADLFEAAMS